MSIGAIAGPLISAGSSILGGLINRGSTENTNQMSIHQAELNRRAQEEFAKKGIRWRVADARAAGIHPLYALGAQTTSFSPVSVGLSADTSFGSGVASAGQDISRAMNATRTAEERVAAVDKTVQDMQVVNMGLQNEMLAAQIAKLKSSINPPMPTLGDWANVSLPEGKLDDRTPLVMFGKKLMQNKGFSDGQTFEDRWGEWGGGAAGLAVMAADLLRNAHEWLSTRKRVPYFN